MKRQGILLLGALAAVASALPASAPAAIGSYEVSACNYAPNAVNNSWTWATTDPSRPSHYVEHTNCPDTHGGTGGASDQEGGLSTTDTLGLSSGAPPGTSAGWTLTAPAGTTIAAITYERYLGHENDTSNAWSPALRADGNTVPGQTCTVTFPNVGCLLGGPPGEGGEPATITGLSAHQLTLGIVCQVSTPETCVTGATEHSAWAAMYGATVTIDDPTPPALNTPSGTLWEPGAYGGFHTGSESVTVSAQDVGGGVQRIVLAADGHPIDTYSAPCDFTFAQPCPLSTGPQTLTLPTTELTDGTHTLTLVATDAAGNHSTVASEQITVDNNPPPPPVDLAVTPTQAGSSTFTMTWSDPAGQVAPITTATYQICPATSPGACSTPAAAPAEGPATVTVPGPGTWTLSLWLTNAAGNSNPINAAHATLIVPAPAGQASNDNPASAGSDSGSDGDGGPSAPRPTIHVAEALHGHQLAVRVTGPATGTVYISYTGRYRRRMIATGAKKATLRKGQLRVTFSLSPLAAAHATIRVSVSLDHHAALISTLHRR